jgi:iron complex outermembrane recepter protein
MKQLWRHSEKISLMAMVAMMAAFLLVGVTLAAEQALPAAKQSANSRNKENTQNLEDVVVTATRTERALESLPVSASVISAKEIQESAAYRVDDLLRELSGVYVRSYQGILSSSTTNDVSMRGLPGEDRVHVLRDGIPINDAYGGAVEFNEVDIEDVQRIEVVRGPGSALYGSNAMGGVINIVTKKPSQQMQTSAKIGYGDMNTRIASAHNSASLGKFGYYLSGGILKSDGYIDIPEDKRQPYYGKKAVDRYHVDGKVTYDLDDLSDLALSIAHYEQSDTGRYKIPGYEVNNDNTRYGLSYQRQGTGWHLSATLYRNEDNSDYTSAYYDSAQHTYNAIAYISSNSQETHGANLQGSLDLGDSHVLTLGGDYKHGDIDRHDDYQTSTRDILVRGTQEYTAVYAQDEMTFGDHWSAILGARQDWWTSSDGYGYDDNAVPTQTYYAEKSDGSFNPKLGINYRPIESTTLRAAAGTAFRAPTLSDLYRTYVGATSTYRANPDLEPEKLVSYEAGIDQRVGDALSLRATYYQTDAEDFVQNIYTETIGRMKYYDKKNVGKVRISGLEIGARLKINQPWSLFANATFNSSKIREYAEMPELEGKYLAHSPRKNYVFGIIYDNADIITAKLTGRYVGARYNDDANETELKSYYTTDIKLSRRLGRHVELALAAENINDVQFEEASGYISPGRMVLGTVEVKF